MKTIIKKIFKIFGYELKKIIQPKVVVENITKDLFYWIKDKEFKTIIDVGANEGQFAIKMRSLFPVAQIISFEPIPEVYNMLKLKFTEDKKFTAYNYGLGTKKETTSFYLNEYSPSSSLLAMNEIHKETFKYTKKDDSIKIQLDRLDDIIKDTKLVHPLLLKIDVQGYEKEVLNGGFKTAEKADVVLLEVSFKQLYKDQPLFDEVYQILKNIGFVYSGNLEQLISPATGEVLQADAIFIKTNNN